MATIKYEVNGKTIEVEVSDEFANMYADMEHKDALIERKETRRVQSLDKSIDAGFDFADNSPSAEEKMEEAELSAEIAKALATLTSKQQFIVKARVFDNQNFTQIAMIMGVKKQTILEQFNAAIKKLKNILQ